MNTLASMPLPDHDADAKRAAHAVALVPHWRAVPDKRGLAEAEVISFSQQFPFVSRAIRVALDAELATLHRPDGIALGRVSVHPDLNLGPEALAAALARHARLDGEPGAAGDFNRRALKTGRGPIRTCHDLGTGKRLDVLTISTDAGPATYVMAAPGPGAPVFGL